MSTKNQNGNTKTMNRKEGRESQVKLTGTNNEGHIPMVVKNVQKNKEDDPSSLQDEESVFKDSGPTTKDPGPEKSNQSKKMGISAHTIMVFMAILFGTVLIFLLLTRYQGPGNNVEKSVAQDKKPSLRKLDELHQKFPSQDNKLWQIVRATVKDPIFEKNPSRPGILLFASDQRTTQTSRCLAESILRIVDDILRCEHITLDLWDLSSLTSDEAYINLHQRIEEGFSGEAKGALLKGLQHLPGDVAMALKSYTDNENALFKKTVIITTLETLDTTEYEPSKWDQVVMPIVSGLWEDTLKVSKAYALGSRVGNNIVVIKAEDSQTLQKSGCTYPK